MIKIVIPNYITKVLKNKSENPKYFKIKYQEGFNIHTEAIVCNKKRPPLKVVATEYQKLVQAGEPVVESMLANGYHLGVFNNKGYVGKIRDLIITGKMRQSFRVILCDENKEPLLANPKRVGKESYIKINGQSFYVGINHFTRIKIIEAIKRQYAEFFPVINKAVLTYPITITYHFQVKEVGNQQDLDNHAMPYIKSFQDFLVTNNIIPDDSTRYINKYAVAYSILSPTSEYDNVLTITIIPQKQET